MAIGKIDPATSSAAQPNRQASDGGFKGSGGSGGPEDPPADYEGHRTLLEAIAKHETQGSNKKFSLLSPSAAVAAINKFNPLGAYIFIDRYTAIVARTAYPTREEAETLAHYFRRKDRPLTADDLLKGIPRKALMRSFVRPLLVGDQVVKSTRGTRPPQP